MKRRDEKYFQNDSCKLYYTENAIRNEIGAQMFKCSMAVKRSRWQLVRISSFKCGSGCRVACQNIISRASVCYKSKAPLSLSLSPSASLSRSLLYHAYKFVYPCSSQLDSAYLPNLPSSFFNFISEFVCVCVRFSSPTVPLCVFFSLTHTALVSRFARTQQTTGQMSCLCVICTKTHPGKEEILKIQLKIQLNSLF